MRYPFSLSRRATKGSVRPIFYIQRWDPRRRRYETAKSAAVLVDLLSLDPEIYSPYQKGGARLIAEVWLSAERLGPKAEAHLTLGEYLLRFWDWDESDYVAGKLARKPGSIGKAHVANNLSWVKRYAIPALGQILLPDLTTACLERWLMDLKRDSCLVNRTLNRVFQSVSLPLREALRLGFIEKDPTASIRPLGEVDVEKGILTTKEVKALLALAWGDQMAYVAFCTALCGGLRLGEVQALRVGAIQNDHVIVAHSYSKVVGLKDTKTSQIRLVTLPQRVLALLRQLAAANPHREEWVFWRSTTPGKPVVERTIERGFYKALESLGIMDDPGEVPATGSRQARRLSYHSLRHWFNATLRGALPDEKLRLLTGHQSEEMTRRYDHLTETDKAILQAAQRDRIEILFPGE